MIKIRYVCFVFVLALATGGCSKEEETPKPLSKPPKKVAPADTAASAGATAPPPAPTAADTAAPATPSFDLGKGVWPPALPREYVKNGQLDLNALTDAMHDWCYYTNRFPTSMQELVTTKFLTNLPSPPPGKKFYINQSKNRVELVDSK